MPDEKPDLRKPMRDRLEAAKAAWASWRAVCTDLDYAWPVDQRFMHITPFEESFSIAAELLPETVEQFLMERGTAQMLDPFWGWLECDAILLTRNRSLIEQLSDWRKAT